MQRTLAFVALGLVLALMPAVNSAAAEPPSVTRWATKLGPQFDKRVNAAAVPCTKATSDDLKLGECYVRRVLPVLQAIVVDWDHQIAGIARGQTKPCRAAIHRYWLAFRRSELAEVAYLRLHRYTSITQLTKDLKEEPYAPLSAHSLKAARNAVRVCG